MAKSITGKQNSNEKIFVWRKELIVTSKYVRSNGKTIQCADIQEMSVREHHSKIASVVVLLPGVYLLFSMGWGGLYPALVSLFVSMGVLMVSTFQAIAFTSKGTVVLFDSGNESKVREFVGLVNRARSANSWIHE